MNGLNKFWSSGWANFQQIEGDSEDAGGVVVERDCAGNDWAELEASLVYMDWFVGQVKQSNRIWGWEEKIL